MIDMGYTCHSHAMHYTSYTKSTHNKSFKKRHFVLINREQSQTFKNVDIYASI